MTRQFRARVFVEVEVEPNAPRAFVEDPVLAFTFHARTVDGAGDEVRRRLLANRRVVSSISYSPGDVVVAKITREILPASAPGVLVFSGVR